MSERRRLIPNRAARQEARDELKMQMLTRRQWVPVSPGSSHFVPLIGFDPETARGQATSHVAGRNARVIDVLCCLSMMASASKSGAGPDRLAGLARAVLTCDGAVLQDFKAKEPNEAAHFLPGQVRINGLFPWDYLSGGASRVFLMKRFSAVEIRDEYFNAADSAAERGPSGLKEVFAEASRIVVRDPAPPSDGRINRDLVARVFERLWIPRAIGAIEIAREETLDKLTDETLLVAPHAPHSREDGPQYQEAVNPRQVKKLEEIYQTLTFSGEAASSPATQPGDSEKRETFAQNETKFRPE